MIVGDSEPVRLLSETITVQDAVRFGPPCQVFEDALLERFPRQYEGAAALAREMTRTLATDPHVVIFRPNAAKLIGLFVVERLGGLTARVMFGTSSVDHALECVLRARRTGPRWKHLRVPVRIVYPHGFPVPTYASLTRPLPRPEDGAWW